MKNKVIGIIPARYGASRFPGKPLAEIGGKTMINRVYDQALKCRDLQYICVATDDERIADEVRSFGGNVVMTNTNHPSGTDRCAEALEKIGENFDVVVNIQGDEPFLDPEQLELLLSCFEDEASEIATLISPIKNREEIFNSNTVKCVINNKNFALYFSRAAIPSQKATPENWDFTSTKYFKHIGLYGYRAKTLKKLVTLSQGILEQTESLEQLRWLEAGFSIKTKETLHSSLSVDTPEDLKKAVELLKL